MNFISRLKIGSEKYPALTGIRAVGATVVFLDHFPFTPGSKITINVLAFFFVLSGFLIVRLYYNSIVLSAHGWRNYFINRFARIYPVYFLLLTIAVLQRHDFHPLLLLKNYTLTHALFFNIKDFVIEPSWSLTAEECFYFLAPFIILLIRKVNFLSSLLFGASLLIVALFISRMNTSFLHTPMFVFSTTFFGHFLEFFAGVYLAIIMLRKEAKGVSKIQGLKWTLAGSASVIVLILLMLFIYQHPPLNHGAIILVNNFLIPFPIGILYYGLMCENSLLGRLLSGKFLGLLGRSSYSFYLLHTIIISYIAIPFLLPHFAGQRALLVVFIYIVTYLLSIILFIFYEEPMNIFIRKKTTSKTNPAAAH